MNVAKRGWITHHEAAAHVIDNTPSSVALSTGHGLSVGLTAAGIGARSYAFIIDWHIRTLLALAWILVFVAGWWLGSRFGFTYKPGAMFGWIMFAPAAALYVLYHPVLEMLRRGSTPGKRLAGIRVVGQDGRDATSSMHLTRNVFRLIDTLPALYCLGIVCCLCNRHELRIGDYAAGTILIYDEHDGHELRRTITRYTATSAHAPEQIKLVADLVSRWPALDPLRRCELAQAALRSLDLSVEATDEPALFARLQGFLKDAGQT